MTRGSKNRRIFCETTCRRRVKIRRRNRAILMLRMVKIAPSTPPMTPISTAGANIITFTGIALPSCTTHCSHINDTPNQTPVYTGFYFCRYRPVRRTCTYFAGGTQYRQFLLSLVVTIAVRCAFGKFALSQNISNSCTQLMCF